MWWTNLKVLLVVLVTVTLYTLVAAWIPQVESEVPEELTFSGEVTTDELVEAGERLYQGAGGCVACHGLGTRAPSLLTDEGGSGPIGARCSGRVPAQDCKAYLHTSMIDPGAYVVEGYQNIMPDMRRTLSDAQIWSIVAFLQSEGGEVTVEASDIDLGELPAATTPGSAAGAGTSPAAGNGGGSLDPMTIFREHACQACHRLRGEGGPIGPPLDGPGARRDADYIRRAILEPNADTAAGYEAVAGTMPANFGQQMTAAQLEALVRFLAEEGGA
ncbi:MAG TPA: c-type cytochrome [Longimicrobiales bacterium]|nr:c-type cytochrome [Longimicrobiales bacterium]